MPTKSPSSLSLTHRYLVCKLSGGLTNQELEVVSCLEIAWQLNRTLVKPLPVTGLSTSSLYASPARGNITDFSGFEQLWDWATFLVCAMKTFHVSVVAKLNNVNDLMSLATPDTLVDLAPWKGVWSIRTSTGSESTVRIPTEWYARAALLRSLLSGSYKMLLVQSPFHFLPADKSKRASARCLVPGQEARASARAILARMPSRFYCIHARVEEDWYDVCCHVPQWQNHRPRGDFLDGKGHARACPNGAFVSRECYLSPARLAAFLLHRVPVGKTLYVATGLPFEHLHPFSLHYTVQTRQRMSSNSRSVGFMSYLDALIDRTVCAKAHLVVGHRSSSYSKRLASGRPLNSTMWYGVDNVFRSKVHSR